MENAVYLTLARVVTFYYLIAIVEGLAKAYLDIATYYATKKKIANLVAELVGKDDVDPK